MITKAQAAQIDVLRTGLASSSCHRAAVASWSQGRMTLRYRDNDKNAADVEVFGPTSGIDLGRRKYVVAIHAEGVWFTPAQARKFAAAIERAATRVTRQQRKICR